MNNNKIMRQPLSKPSALLMQIMILAALNMLTGWLGLKLAIPPGYVTAVFPPAGFALGALLLWGIRAWPGVFLGSIGLNILVGSLSPVGLNVIAVCLALLIACGSTLQAVAGCYLVERFLPDAKSLRDGRKLVMLLLLGGALACLIASGIGSLALVALGKNNWQNWPFSMWSWWIGDTIGVILFTPMFLVIAKLNRTNWRRPVASIILPSLTMLALVVQLFIQANIWERQRIEAAFHSKARTIEDDLHRDIDRYQDAVFATRQLFKSTGDVSPEAFHQFTADLIAKYPGILALEYVDQINGDQRSIYEQRMVASGLGGFHIKEINSANLMVYAAKRTEYFPIRYIEPQVKYRWLLGFDMASEPLRRAAFIQARDSNSVTVSPSITLLNNNSKGLMVLIPHYTLHGEQGQQFAGVAMAVFMIEAVIGQAIPESLRTDINVRVYDVTNPNQPDPLYLGKGSGNLDLYPTLQSTSPLNFGNRKWRLEMSATPSFINQQLSYVSWLVLAGGFLFTGILQMLLLSLTSYARNVEDEVERRTRELAESEHQLSQTLGQKDTLLKEVYHRVKNNLQVIISLLNLESYTLESGIAKEAIEKMGARVRAMALVHEKLYLSGNLASVELANYVKDLLNHLHDSGSAYGQNIRMESDVEQMEMGLDAAIPLGLLLNELISNSIKHGFPQGRSGTVRVSLRRESGALLLQISDDGIGMPPDFDVEQSTSMGLKLASSLARQLGGSLQIESDRGSTFSVRITLP